MPVCCGSSGENANAQCGCAVKSSKANSRASWITGYSTTPAADVAMVSTRISWGDRIGSWKARWGIGRMSYMIPPGLYGIGNPTASSPVFVTANYKMSFDRLRGELSGMNGWILVLDTKGINVWCAAGKGTFGTEELNRRIAETGLAQIVDHRTLILPQLGAVGVAAHEVREISGFKVVYGPVRAADLPEFMGNGMQATPAMREVRFGSWERLILTPVELTNIIFPVLALFAAVIILNWIARRPVGVGNILQGGLVRFGPFFGAVLTGAVLTPFCLPWIPGRAFAWKGWVLGLLWALIVVWGLHLAGGSLQTAAFLLALPAISAFLAMNFTGASTYTSLSGVLQEMKVAMPIIKWTTGIGLVLWVAGLFVRI